MSQMFAVAKLAGMARQVKPDAHRQRETESGGSDTSNLRRCAGKSLSAPTSTIPTARCGPACRVVWEGSISNADRPYPDCSMWVRSWPFAVEISATNFGRCTFDSGHDLPHCNTPLSTHCGPA